MLTLVEIMFCGKMGTGVQVNIWQIDDLDMTSMFVSDIAKC